MINTASVAAFDGQIGQVAYSASKGAIVGKQYIRQFFNDSVSADPERQETPPPPQKKKNFLTFHVWIARASWSTKKKYNAVIAIKN